mgnify:CR=1 FL=1
MSEDYCKLLKEAMRDEEKGRELYQKLIASIGKPDYLPIEDTLPREVLISILHQEDNHERLLRLIHSLRCPVK